MNTKRQSPFRAERILNFVIAFLYFSFRIISEYGRGAKHPILHALIAGILFFTVYMVFCALYKDFRRVSAQPEEYAASHVISVVITDILFWIEATQTWPLGKAPFVTLVLIPALFQITAIIFHAYIIRPNLDRKQFPADTLLIAGEGSGNTFQITQVLSDEDPLPELFEAIRKNSVIILHHVSPEVRPSLIRYCEAEKKTLYFTADLDDLPIRGSEPSCLLDTVLLKQDYACAKENYWPVKRFLDLLFSALFIVLLSPLFILISILVKLADNGPVFQRQRCYTLDGKVFTDLKFRSVTGNVGKLICRYRLDELPRLVNILQGDMSFVGPAPEHAALSDLYAAELPEFKDRLRVKAGLTGPARVYGRHIADPYDKLRLDLMYVGNQSFFQDIKILMLSAAALFRTDGTTGIDKSRGTVNEEAPTNLPFSFLNWDFVLIRRCLQGVYYPLLALYCCREITYLIAWKKREPFRIFAEAAFSVLKPWLWSLALIAAVILVLESLQASCRLKEHFLPALRRCLFQPGIIHLAVFATGIYLMQTFGQTELATLPLLLVYLAGFMSDRKTAYLLYFFYVLGIVLAATTCLLHLSKDKISVFYYGTCHSFGFTNANPAGMFIFYSFLLGWFLYGSKNKRRFFFSGMITAIGCYLVTGCRTAVLLLLFLVVYNTWLKDLKTAFSEKTLRTLITILPLIALVFSIAVGTALYPIDEKVNSTFMVRMVDFIYAFKEKGLSLYPQDFSESVRRYYFDNGYYYWIYTKGLLASAGLLLPVLLTNYRIALKKNPSKSILILLISLYFCMEGYMISLMIIVASASGIFNTADERCGIQPKS